MDSGFLRLNLHGIHNNLALQGRNPEKNLVLGFFLLIRFFTD